MGRQEIPKVSTQAVAIEELDSAEVERAILILYATLEANKVKEWVAGAAMSAMLATMRERGYIFVAEEIPPKNELH